MERQEFAPSERLPVRFRAPAGTPASAWVGIVPAHVQHGSRVVNDQHDIQFQQLGGRTEGELVFAPVKPGAWTLRMNVGDAETASVAFTVADDVVPPGQNRPSLSMERTRFAPSEKLVVRFAAPAAYPANAWIGLIPAEVEHGSRAVNDRHDVQFQNLGGRTDGELAFSPVAPGKWTLRMNAFEIETASVAFEVADDVVPPGQNQPSLSMERTRFAPSERIAVQFTAPQAYPAGAWIGIVPADTPHGSRTVNDQHDVQFQQLGKRAAGELTFAPVPPGKWSLRMNAFEIETAAVDFEVADDVVPPGQNGPSLSMKRARFAPSERIAVQFTAPQAYPAGAWIGIVPADTPHGSRTVNDQHDVQFQQLGKRTTGELTFAPVPPGKWSLRMNAFEIETAAVDFEVAPEVVPEGMNLPALAVARTRFAPGESIRIHFTAPKVYPASAWIGLVPAGVEHGSRSRNDAHDVQFQHLGGRTDGVLIFTSPGPGEWTARMNAFEIETASVAFSVVAGLPAAAAGDPPFVMTVTKAPPETTPTVKPAGTPAGSASADQPRISKPSATVATQPGSAAPPAPRKPVDAASKPTTAPAPQAVASVSEPASEAPDKSGKPDAVAESASPGSPDTAAANAAALPDWVSEMPPLPAPVPTRPVEPLDLRDITREEYAGIVSQAKETVAELLGPMSPAQAEAYSQSWQPMFTYPAAACIDYLEKIIPLAERALMLRIALLEAAQTTSELWDRAALAEYHDPEAARDLMMQVRTRTAGVASLKAAMDQLVAQLTALGGPPDPLALQAQAQARHRKAMRTLETLLGGTPELSGIYERTGSLSCTEKDARGHPIYVGRRTEDRLHTRAIKPLQGSRSDLVLFSELEYHEPDGDGGFLDRALGDGFDDESWNAWYGEPTGDGWVHYDYDEDDKSIEAIFYRPGEDEMIVDRYWIHGDLSEATREVYHRAPLDKGTKLYADGQTEASILKMIRENPEDLAAAEQAFRAGKAAFAQHLARVGDLPRLANPDELYWVLKDIKVDPKPEPRTKADRAYGEGTDYEYQELKAFEHGNNHFSTTWADVAVTWTYSSGSPPVEVPEGSVYIAGPDEEFVGTGPVAKATEKRTPRAVAVHWEPAPPVIPDGAFWEMNPTVEGRGGAFAINSILLVKPDGYEPADMPTFSMPGLSDEPRGLLILPHPIAVDAAADAAEEKALKRQVTGTATARREPMSVSLRSSRLRAHEHIVPVLVAAPTGYVRLDHIYEQRLLDEEEARALASSMQGRLPSVELSEAAKRHTAAKSASAAEEASLAEAVALAAERIAFHEANIAFSRSEAGRLAAEMAPLQARLRDGTATAEEIGRLNQMNFRRISQLSQVVSEQDRIQESKTGVPTHTRTPFDEMCRSQLIQKCRESVRDLEGGIRARRKAEYLMEKMDPGQRRIALGILEKIGQDGGGLHAGDYQRLNDAMQNIFQGNQEFEQAQLEEQAAYEHAFVEGAEYVKTGADVGLMLTSLGGGPMFVNVAYQVATGTIEKDVVEGLKRGIATYSDAADVLISGYDGWRSGGFWGAVEGASLSLVMNKGPEVAMGRLNYSRGFDGGYRPLRPDGGSAPKPATAPAPAAKPSTRGAEAIQAGKFQQEMEYGEALATDYFRDYTQWKSAQIRGDMPPAEFSRLEMQVRQKAAAVAHSMTAKSYLKYGAPARMGSAFTEVHTEVLGDAMKSFNLEMKQLGYNEQTLVQFRNKSSMDAGMDADLGLVEKPDFLPVKNADGTVTFRENHWLTRNGQPVSLEQWQADARRVMAANYKHVSGGYSGHQSFVDVTTRVHPESYRDKNWLVIPKAGPHADVAAVTKVQDRIFGQIRPEYTPHSLGVTVEKAEIMFREHPELRPLGSMMETCRGTAKDLDTKFIPLVDAKIRELEAIPAAKRGPEVARKLHELGETRQYLDQCRSCLGDIGKGRTHPGRWMSDFRMITGGEDPIAVTRRLARLTLDASRM